MNKAAILSMLLIVTLGCRGAADPDADKPIVPEGFDEKLLETLKCPENLSPLRFAKKKELADINNRIGALTLKTWAGPQQLKHLDAVLIRADGKIGYRVDGIVPVMDIMEALVLDEKVGPPDPKSHRK